MLPSSAIRVVESTPSRLVIIDPPFYTLGIGFLICSIVAAAIWLRPGSSPDQRRFSWWAVVAIGPILLSGIGLLTSTTRIILSAHEGTVKIDRRYFGLFHSGQQFPTGELRQVSVETSEGYRSLVFVLQ